MRPAVDQNRFMRVGAGRPFSWVIGHRRASCVDGVLLGVPSGKIRACSLSTRVALAAFVVLVNLRSGSANAQVVRIADSPPKVAITDDARAKARDIFTQRCATCHGADGHGKGPAAANLKPKPIDFHSQDWQKSVTDDTMTKAIVFGGRSVGKSGQMAPNPDLEDEPGIVAALVEKIRKWGK
jgi:mono/diheme cytochrome c family protein